MSSGAHGKNGWRRLTSDTGATSSGSGLSRTSQDTGRDAAEVLGGSHTSERSGERSENERCLHFDG